MENTREKCPQCHVYDDENSYVYRRKDGRIERHRRICVRAVKRRFRARHRAGL